MERLTHWNDRLGRYTLKQTERGMWKIVTRCLGEYEDTGLTPEQIREIDKAFSAQAKELAEYKKAEEQGILIRVPVARWDSIWEIIDDGVDKAYIQKIEVQEVSECLIWANHACFDYEDIGNIVFLNREEADKALKRMMSNNEIN